MKLIQEVNGLKLEVLTIGTSYYRFSYLLPARHEDLYVVLSGH